MSFERAEISLRAEYTCFALLSRGNRVEGLDVISRHVGYISKKQKGEALGASDTVVI